MFIRTFSIHKCFYPSSRSDIKFTRLGPEDQSVMQKDPEERSHSQDLQIICCFNSFVILLCQTRLDKQLKIKNSPQSRFRLSPNHYYPLTFKVKIHNPKIQLYLIQHILESSYKTFHVGKMEHVIAINILSSKNLGQFILMVKLLTYLSM